MSDKNVILLPVGADEYAEAETARKQRLFDWADGILEELGLTRKVKGANSFDELRKIMLDGKAVEVTLAIRSALHPASGKKDACFNGLNEAGLKRILRLRLGEKKDDRDHELRKGTGAASGAGQRTVHDWTDDLQLDDEGGVRPLLNNLILYLRHHQKWRGVLCYDAFSVRVVIRKTPPWGIEPTDTQFTDHHYTLTRTWFQREQIFAAHGDVIRAVQAAAVANTFNPVREYLDALEWDGKLRIDEWLSKYMRADNTPYTRAVGPRFLISAVARVFNPGCKVDHMLTLEGKQGTLKSASLRALAVRDAWFTDQLSHLASKDAAMETAGVWIIEIAELDALARVATSTTKNFLTRQFERYRPPFGINTVQRGRQCIFAGTINPPAGGYLKDPTGSRRIWPVRCNGFCDRDALERDRDQLWAEAVVRFKAGAPWWLETPALEKLATAEQAARYKIDTWHDPVVKWIGRKLDVSVTEVLERALHIVPKNQTQSAKNRVVDILTQLGFDKYRANKKGQRENRYHRENRKT